MNRHPLIDLSPAVAEALAQGRPVVALESTIIAHGFPYPQNLEMALAVEGAIRDGGAVPATVAVIGGRFKVGLTRSEIESVALSPDWPKISIRDLPVLAARGLNGATTVASTAQIAHWAGIEVFVTGGIGGAHRGWGETLDISADLPTLARIPMAVICAGAKTVLDIPATMEYLETHGVTVLGYQTDSLPGFYIRETGHPIDARIETPAEAAAVLRARQSMGLPGAVLVAVPIPAADALDEGVVNELMAAAEAEMAEAGLRGKAVTPYMLKRLHAASAGQTVRSNQALVLNNARVGAAVAAALAGSKG